LFERFDVVWTPTVLLFDSNGKERVRLEGYLPINDFNAALMNGLARIAFVRKKYHEAKQSYAYVITHFGTTQFAAEAMYWHAVAHYKATNDYTALGKVAEDLRSIYPLSMWASKAIPWLH
jgi:thioredoxin-related protein